MTDTAQRYTDPYRSLAVAVLATAFRDATSWRQRDKVDARHFLCGEQDNGVWLRLWCDLAGISVTHVMQTAKRKWVRRAA